MPRQAMRSPLSALGIIACLIVTLTATAHAAEKTNLPHQSWSFQGGLNAICGTFEPAALQRGFQVYDQVCASCHSMSLLSYRDLALPGGPEFSAAMVKAIAAEKTVPADAPNEDGDLEERPGLPRDRFVSPFPNDQAARAANGGALPPDLALITKARVGGVDYIYALLTGYHETPANFTLDDGLSFNAYFSGYQIKMPNPLYEDAVDYQDGTPATVENMSHDVVTFLAWAAETHMVERRRLGFITMIMIAILTGLFYFSMQRLWRDQHDH